MNEKPVQLPALIIASLSSFLTPFMVSAINIALPSIEKEFKTDTVLLSWVATSYLLAEPVFNQHSSGRGDCAAGVAEIERRMGRCQRRDLRYHGVPHLRIRDYRPYVRDFKAPVIIQYRSGIDRYAGTGGICQMGDEGSTPRL